MRVTARWSQGVEYKSGVAVGCLEVGLKTPGGHGKVYDVLEAAVIHYLR